MRKLPFVFVFTIAVLLTFCQLGAAQNVLADVTGIIQSVTIMKDHGKPYVEVEILLADESVQAYKLSLKEARELNLLTEKGVVEESKVGTILQAEAVTGTETTTNDTPWGTPVLVSPAASGYLYHFPRTTTLVWRPVIGANSYKVERAYLSGTTTWSYYSAVCVAGFYNTHYTFDFVGDQKGAWKVTGYTGGNCTGGATPTSAWRYFYYKTIPILTTPVLVGPAASSLFDHYPRTLTLSWKMIHGVGSYRVEVYYCNADKTVCNLWRDVVVSPDLNASYTFDFVGAQPGKWRVTSKGTPGVSQDSAASAFRYFTFTR